MEVFLSSELVDERGGLNVCYQVLLQSLKEKMGIVSCTITPKFVVDYDGEEGNNGYIFLFTNIEFVPTDTPSS